MENKVIKPRNCYECQVFRIGGKHKDGSCGVLASNHQKDFVPGKYQIWSKCPLDWSGCETKQN